MGIRKMQSFIRKANPNDVDYIVDLSLKAINYMSEILPEDFGSSFKLPTKELERKSLIESFEDKNTIIFVAENEREIIGYIMGVIENYQDDLLESPYLTIQYIYILKKFQNSGIGKSLIAEIEKFAKAKNIKNIDLIVWNSNKTAKEFFRKLNYVPLEIRMVKKLEIESGN